MIEVNQLSKHYGAIQAVKSINFTIESGEVVGFLGPNGAGKTTTMNILAGYIPCSGGSVKICGYDIREKPDAVKRRIGYLPERLPLYLDMTVNEYLYFVSQIKKVNPRRLKRYLSQVMETVRIEEVQKRLIRNLSRGYKQRVGLAQALIGNPEVLILDEPTVGLDPNQIIEIRKLIKNLGKAHTIILSSHTLPEISVICERVIIINKGEIVAQDTLANLTRNTVIQATLIMKISGEPAQIITVLQNITGITQVRLLTDKDNPVHDYLIETDQTLDVREPIFFALAGIKCPILELKPNNTSLEDIFVQLTTESEGEKQS